MGHQNCSCKKLLSEKANIAHNLSGDEQGKAWGGCTMKAQNFQNHDVGKRWKANMG